MKTDNENTPPLLPKPKVSNLFARISGISLSFSLPWRWAAAPLYPPHPGAAAPPRRRKKRESQTDPGVTHSIWSHTPGGAETHTTCIHHSACSTGCRSEDVKHDVVITGCQLQIASMFWHLRVMGLLESPAQVECAASPPPPSNIAWPFFVDRDRAGHCN